MKKFLTLTLMSLLQYVAHSQYTQIEVYARNTNGKIEPNINIFGVKKISKRFDVIYLAITEQHFAQATVGLQYSPSKYMSCGWTIGIATTKKLYATTAHVYLSNNKNSLLVLGGKTDGKNSFWYKMMASKNFSPKIQMSLVAWKFHGLGCMYTYKFKNNQKIWIMPSYDLEFKQARIITGVQVMM